MATLDDATHLSLDQKVTAHFDAELGVPPDGIMTTCEFVFILRTIVNNSNDTLDPKYADRRAAEDLTKTDTNLLTLLRTAWDTKSYRAIRELPVLQAARPASPVEALWYADSLEDVLYRSFNAPYRGAAVHGFCQYLEDNNAAFGIQKDPVYYGKFCSIVQSSGTGKSRLMFELSKEGVVVLYMNLRPQADDSGFPPRDMIPAHILTRYTYGGAVSYAARCCAFFAAVFTTLTKYLSKDMESDVKAAKERWAANMCDVRSKERERFFEAFLDNYKDFVTKIYDVPNAVAITTAHIDKLLHRDAAWRKTESMPGERLMTSAYGDMIKALNPLFEEGKPDAPKLVIAVDEAYHLSVVDGLSYRPSAIFCKAISLFSGEWRVKNHPVWVVFAATTSKVADCTPPHVDLYSRAPPLDGQLLFAPYCQLGWDQHADPLESIAATDVAKAHHIISYGRPLWTSLKDNMWTVTSMLTFAVSKLCGPIGLTDRALAFLGQRFCLTIAFGHREAAAFIESSVASHMRVCVATTENRNWTFTTYPSEPLLSCAAAAILHQALDQSEYLSVLEAKVDNGMIDVGKGGELASRLLWLLAKDLLVRQMHPFKLVIRPEGNSEQEWDSEFVDCTLIPVHDYFKFLFGENFWSVAGPRAAAAFENAYVNFSHWVSMDEYIWNNDRSDQLSASEWTLRHWHRTSAVQCCRDQPLIDKMIPIFFKPETQSQSSDASHDHSKDLACVSQIFISDKASKHDNRLDLDEITRNHESIQCNSSLPWVAILADLGLTGGELELTAEYSEVIPETTAGEPEPDSDGPCLRIYAPAISVETFPFLTAREPLRTLRKIICHEEMLSNRQKIVDDLHAQMQYGTIPTKHHMTWEDRGT